MIKQYVSLVEAKKRSTIVFDKTINKFEKYCSERKKNLFFDTVANAFHKTSIHWKELGFHRAGEVIEFNNCYVINMNINYLYSKDAKKFVKLTLIHEMAHIVAKCNCGTFRHNKIFKKFDKILGGRGTTYHNYDTPTNKPERKSNRIEVVCPICGTKYSLTKYMIERCKDGERYCRKCKTNMIDIVK